MQTNIMRTETETKATVVKYNFTSANKYPYVCGNESTPKTINPNQIRPNLMKLIINLTPKPTNEMQKQ